jgi:hypothetical protein
MTERAQADTFSILFAAGFLAVSAWCVRPPSGGRPPCNAENRGEIRGGRAVGPLFEICREDPPGTYVWVRHRDFCGELRQKPPAEREVICRRLGLAEVENCSCPR